jgi:[ribosomal protein S5]-alanine N-acetyltransferase
MMYLYNDGLETQRLTTRFLTAADAPAWELFLANPESGRFAPDDKKEPLTERAIKWIDFCLKRYQEQRYGLQALIDKGTGAFVGQCGLILQEVGGKNEIEIGYHLFPQYRGMGYATEAARAFRNYGFENDIAASIISLIHSDNTNSKHVALRNGMTFRETTTAFRNYPCEVYRITKEEWLKSENDK